MAGNQLQAEIKEASKVLSGKFSKREDISINIEEEMGLIEEQQLEAKSEERNSGMRYSIGEDASTHSKIEIGLKKVVQQGEKIPFTSNTSPTTDEVGDAGELVNLINGELDNAYPSPSSEFSIYRVPQIIRKVNEEAYDPRVISIGPFHHGDAKFKSLEAFKMRFLKKVVQRSTGVGLEKYVEFLKEQEASVRQCYSEIIEMGSNEFVRMLLLDGCFIVELFLSYYYHSFRDVDYAILGQVRLWEDIRHDLVLLENQIPFFVLEGLFNLATMNFEPMALLNISILYFEANYIPQMKSHDDIKPIMHFTDLILIHHRPMSQRIETQEYGRTMTVTELDDVGVKFEMGSSKCLLDIKFSKGVLEIPRITIDDITEFLFRNMIALELCHYENKTFIIDYIYFMDNLINTSKDVDLLVQSGVIFNMLGDSKQVADIINNICINVSVLSENLIFYNLCEEINAFCKIPKHKWRAVLKRDYFSSPWRSASTSAAIILLGLTLIQTVCSLLSSVTGN